MPLGTNHQAEGAAGIGSFFAEEYSNLVIAQYNAKTAMKGLATMIPHGANSGETINIPVEGLKQAASRKVFETQVNLNSHQSTNLTMKIDQQFEFNIH
jgi:hypothetical protein